MANPNIVNVSSIIGKTAFLTPTAITSTVILANSADTNKVFRINNITAANVNGVNPVDTTVSVNTTATGSGTSFPIVSTVAVPADATLIVTDKSTAFYLEENESIVVTSGTSAGITYVVSYEEIA